MQRRNLRDDLASVEHLIKSCQNKMTAWELDFIDSVHDQLTSGRPLFGKQGETLDGMWETLVTEATR